MNERLIEIGRRNPLLLWIAAVILGLIAVPAVLYNSQGAVVLYQAF